MGGFNSERIVLSDPDGDPDGYDRKTRRRLLRAFLMVVAVNLLLWPGLVLARSLLF